MTAIASLPVVDVYIAFSSTDFFGIRYNSIPSSGQSNGTWTNVSQYVEEIATKSGRQHYLDRIESATATLTLNNRDGSLWNTIAISVRTPIVITGTWGGVTYPVFFGFIDSIEEKLLDQLNSELVITASDYLKFLSLRRMTSATFWPTYANTAFTRRWYRLDSTPSATVTYATATSTTSVTYTAINTFQAGQQVSISGLSIGTGSNLSLSNVTIASATATTFTVTTSGVTSGSTSVGTGVAYRTAANNVATIGSDGSGAGTLAGQIAFNNYGALIYDEDNCVDLANGSSTGTGALAMVPITTSNPAGGFDFWILGSNMNQSVITKYWVTISGTQTEIYLEVSATGTLQCVITSAGLVASAINVNDGYWHHVGITIGTTGYLELYCDGVFYPFSSNANLTSLHSNGQTNYIGGKGGLGSTVTPVPMLLDEVVISSTATGATPVLNRYRAGTLLQLGFPVTAGNVPGTSTNRVSSGDRIAEILTLAGFGAISNGNVVLDSNLYYINGNTSSAWSQSINNGYVDVEPYYWDSPITNSTALDLILQICDTDIGTFHQRPNGLFNFSNQNYYGTWTWNGTSTAQTYSFGTLQPNTGHWAPNSYSTDIYHTLSDQDVNNTPYYGPSTQIIYDDTDLWTMVRVTPQSGAAQVYENSGAEAQYGLTVLEKSSTVHPSLNACLSTAHYLGYLYQNPLARVTAVEVRSSSGNGYWNKTLLGLGLGDVVNFKRIFPGQTSGVSTLMIVESIRHQVYATTGEWRTTFVLDPYPLRGAGNA